MNYKSHLIQNTICSDFWKMIETKIKEGVLYKKNKTHPFVTLSFAQSLDGSISFSSDKRVGLSSPCAQIFTHMLRASHDAILIGIGTLLADDPFLTVRHVTGRNPQPIVVDSHLRIPIAAQLLKNKIKPWIATTGQYDFKKQKDLSNSGIKVFSLNPIENGWVNLSDLLTELFALGINNVMVEGGSRILSSFLAEDLADQLVVTISPLILGGLRAINCNDIMPNQFFNSLNNVYFQSFGNELLIRGDLS